MRPTIAPAYCLKKISGWQHSKERARQKAGESLSQGNRASGYKAAGVHRTEQINVHRRKQLRKERFVQGPLKCSTDNW